MNIVILAGGTGSIALQEGLYNTLDNSIADGIDTKIIVNAYDNGLSTGMVRKVLGGQILGPSDVRKNQTTRLKLENPNSPWNKFLDIRFTCESSNAKKYCIDAVDNLSIALLKSKTELDGWADECTRKSILVKEAISAFFESPIAFKIDYNDFSLANIIYAGFAKANKNSLRKAASVMADLMGIKDNVLLNDDTSLFLGAIAADGTHVTDEGDIVSWGKVDNPFVDVFFTDANGHKTVPTLCQEAVNALLAADLIILSSGTQWSSLIPTYASSGFKEVISRCAAKIIMVMNRQPDNDSPGQTASEIIQCIIPKFFPIGKVNLILDSSGHPQMSSIDLRTSGLLESVSSYTLGAANTSTKHNANALSTAIGKTFFGEYLNSKFFMFDYDDTLVGRGNFQLSASVLNRQLICSLKYKEQIAICTGNSIKAVTICRTEINDADNIFSAIYTPLKVYADGGINLYEYDTRFDNMENSPVKFIKHVNHKALIKTAGMSSSQNIISLLNVNGIPLSKIENRGDVVISIKPIDPEYRMAILSLVRLLIQDSELKVDATGRTTIDIMHHSVSKADAVKDVLSSGVESITFVGDEFKNGNDAPIAAMNDNRVKCLQVSDPAMTAFFILTLLNKNRGH